MPVKVKFFADCRDIMGTAEIDVDLARTSESLASFLKILVNGPGRKLENKVIENIDDVPRLARGYKIMVNNRIHDDDEDLEISEGDEVGILPPFAGGC